MPKIAFLFPGQGSQYVGMGKDFFEDDSTKDLFLRANRVVGADLARLCMEGPEEELSLTENTQPAILLVSAAAHKMLRVSGVQAEYAAGHSLGEYSALLAADAIEFEDVLSIVKKRGKFMQEAAPAGAGAMAAIIGLPADSVAELCKEAENVGFVKPANYNSPKQTVVAGEKKAVEEVGKLAFKSGAIKVVELSVSAPFHTRMIREAENRLTVELERTGFKDLSIPVVTNVDATPVRKSGEAIDALRRQVCAPVLWAQSISYLLEQGVDTFIEIGPGRVLSKLLKRIDRKARSLNVEDKRSLEKTLEAL